jgi:hypothetical protein
MTALARTSSNCERETYPLVREGLYKDYENKCSVEKNTNLYLEWLGAKTN